MINCTIKKNAEHNSTEIIFSEKPAEAVREALKAARFRWHAARRVWYGYKTPEETRELIEKAAGGPSASSAEKKPAAKKEPVNKYGVKVGDLFSASWGYDQTNVNFFQVIALAGAESVRVREVYPPMISQKTEGLSPMAADRTYKTGGLPILPAASYSSFIKDQERGDLKRIRNYSTAEVRPQFYLDSFCDAYKIFSDTSTFYESWYA